MLTDDFKGLILVPLPAGDVFPGFQIRMQFGADVSFFVIGIDLETLAAGVGVPTHMLGDPLGAAAIADTQIPMLGRLSG